LPEKSTKFPNFTRFLPGNSTMYIMGASLKFSIVKCFFAVQLSSGE